MQKVEEILSGLDADTLEKLKDLDLLDLENRHNMPFPAPMCGFDYFREVIEKVLELKGS